MTTKRSYPLAVANLNATLSATPHQRSILQGTPLLGEVLISYGEKHKRHEIEKIREEIEPLIQAEGFHFAKHNKGNRGLFPLYDYTYGAGSIEWHEDDGYGFMAGLLLAVAPLSRHIGMDERSGSPCTLLTAQRSLPLYPGDLFIFNANRTHGWLANCKWLLACFMIRPNK